jgi:ABC-2 type transport system ATP-binding protein
VGGNEMTMAPLAELSVVCKRFGAIVALDGLSLEVRRGELLAVLGPNGAGKSTAIALMLGLQRPAAGSVRLFGQAPGLATRRRVGVMMQDVALAPELKVAEHITLVASYYSTPLPVQEVMAATRTDALAGRAYGTLSGGQKRLVQFAVALCGVRICSCSTSRRSVSTSRRARPSGRRYGGSGKRAPRLC